MEKVKKGNQNVPPILVPISEDYFFDRLRSIVREELKSIIEANGSYPQRQIDGITHLPLYDIEDVCSLFRGVSRSTIYEWIHFGILKPKKLRGKVFFLWEDIRDYLKREEPIIEEAQSTK